MPKYSFEDGKYIMFYSDNGDVICSMEEVSIAFSKDDGMWTLHKHGRKESVQHWYDLVTRNYRARGLSDIANEMVMVTGKFPVEELNKCIDISGYIRTMCKKLGLEV